MSHIQYKVGQAAQAQKELFEAIRQSNGVYFFTAVESGAVFSQCTQPGKNKQNEELKNRKIQKPRSNENFTLASLF